MVFQVFGITEEIKCLRVALKMVEKRGCARNGIQMESKSLMVHIKMRKKRGYIYIGMKMAIGLQSRIMMLTERPTLRKKI